MQLGLRLGPDPKILVTSTPKPRKAFRTILAATGTVRALTEDGRIPTTNDNPHLPQARRDELYRLYGGKRIGRQELSGEDLEDVEGAYWTGEMIERTRLKDALDLQRVVVAVDPATTAGEDSDETGVGAAGKGLVHGRSLCCIGQEGHEDHAGSHPAEPHSHYFVLEDATLRGSPSEWANAAIALYDRRAADRVIGETNNGGDMVESTIRNVRRTVPYRKVVASRGKDVRAEPISALYEVCLVHHVGQFPELEDQMTTLPRATASKSGEHDDRIDWLVYALTELHTAGVAFMAGAVQHGRGSAAKRDQRRGNAYVDPRGEEAVIGE
jgi:phage terminase large subunit-like protein